MPIHAAARLANAKTLIAVLVIGASSLMSTVTAATPNTTPPGPSEQEGFAFLEGEWRVRHQRLKEPLSGKTEWNVFEGRARFITLLDGLVSVEELGDGDGKPYGGAMRTFDRHTRLWSDRWVPMSSGVLQEPVTGRFEGDTGTFTSPDEFNGEKILVRGQWQRITKTEVTWEQAASRDGGKTWETNWKMRFVKTPAP